MNIVVRPHPIDARITLVAFQGRLDTVGEPAASPQVLMAVEACEIGAVFDLAGLDFVSSSGLRLMLQAYKNCTARGKKLAMVRTQPAVYKIFKLSGFDQLFNMHLEEGEAVEAMRATE